MAVLTDAQREALLPVLRSTDMVDTVSDILDLVGGVTAGTVTASKAVVANTTGGVDALNIGNSTITNLTTTASTLGSTTISALTGLGVTAQNLATGGGTVIANAKVLTPGVINHLTSADNTCAAKLPTAAANVLVLVRNVTVSKYVSIFPTNANVQIDALGAGNAFNLAVNMAGAMFYATNATQWWSMPFPVNVT